MVRTVKRNQTRARGRISKRPHWPRITLTLLIIFVLTVTAGGGILYARPLPQLSSSLVTPSSFEAAASADIPWPAFGQAAIGLAGSGIMATSTASNQTPLPTASVAKTMTALAILDKKPLAPGQAGPTITITKNDLDMYDWYFARDGSLAAMQVGEKISQYDALEAILLPSANNYADTLAIWAFGSIDAYVEYANKLADSYGMTSSHFADASGFSAQTVSTADDLVRLGDRALRNPVLAEIVAKRSAEIPVAGTIYNVNGLLGRSGINGIKTGSTDQAGGVFLASAQRQLANGKTGTVIVCVMGGPDLVAAMLAVLPLLDAAAANITDHTIATKGQSFGSYSSPWNNQTAKAVATKEVTITAWRDARIKLSTALKPLSGAQDSGAEAGALTATAGTQSIEAKLRLDHNLDAPSVWWRVSRR